MNILKGSGFTVSKLLWTGALRIQGFCTLLKGTLTLLWKCRILLYTVC